MKQYAAQSFRTMLAGLMLFTATDAWAGAAIVHTNEAYIDETLNTPDFQIDDKMAVFRLVLESLPASVKVYPTENYYYFWFHHDGIKYAGNIRFDVEDRDQGHVHFNYFKDFTPWQRDESDFNAVLGKENGVLVNKAGNLSYDVSYSGKTVRFDLNDLSGVVPPNGAVGKGETYIGPVFDESGLRFFLVFHEALKIFMFILDETIPVAEQFDVPKESDRLNIGIRSGFAFYDDRHSKRKILVGVNQLNTSTNNYFDGPFDQLPDNFIKGEALRRAILAASPEMKGEIDRFGNSPDNETRYLIAPYLQYEDVSDLGVIAQCAATEKLPSYYSCFSFTGNDDTPGEQDSP